MFKMYDRVYHKNLKQYGAFDGYDDLDKDTCYVIFGAKDGYEDNRRVSINQLVSANENIEEN